MTAPQSPQEMTHRYMGVAGVNVIVREEVDTRMKTFIQVPTLTNGHQAVLTGWNPQRGDEMLLVCQDEIHFCRNI